MADIKQAPGAYSVKGTVTPSPVTYGGVSAPKPASKTRRRVASVVRGAASAAEAAGPALPGGWGKAAALLAGAAGSLIEKKLAPPAEASAQPDAGAAAASTATVGTEAKLAALLGPAGAGPAGSSGAGAVAVGSMLIGGVLVSPEPYDSETGARLAVAARVFGAANALELAVARMIDLPAGQLLTFVMNRGYR